MEDNSMIAVELICGERTLPRINRVQAPISNSFGLILPEINEWVKKNVQKLGIIL